MTNFENFESLSIEDTAHIKNWDSLMQIKDDEISFIPAKYKGTIENASPKCLEISYEGNIFSVSLAPMLIDEDKWDCAELVDSMRVFGVYISVRGDIDDWERLTAISYKELSVSNHERVAIYRKLTKLGLSNDILSCINIEKLLGVLHRIPYMSYGYKYEKEWAKRIGIELPNSLAFRGYDNVGSN